MGSIRESLSRTGPARRWFQTKKSSWHFSWYLAYEDEFGLLQIKLLAPEFESHPLRHLVSSSREPLRSRAANRAVLRFDRAKIGLGDDEAAARARAQPAKTPALERRDGLAGSGPATGFFRILSWPRALVDCLLVQRDSNKMV